MLWVVPNTKVMSKYKCTNSFKSQGGKNYSYADKIDSSQYSSLHSSEQSNFRKEDDDNDSPFGFGKPASIAMGDMLGTGIPGGIDMDFTTLL